MWDKIARYFGFGPDLYEAEGWFSWQHIVFVSVFVAVTIFLALFLAHINKDKDRKAQLKVLKIAAIVMISAELIKIILIEWQGIINSNYQDFGRFRSVLPLFLCSILLISLPVAAFAKGRIQEAALDFTMVFGYIACLAGTYLAGNIFQSPILSFHVNVSTFTHCISGFSAIYITATRLAKMEKRNIWIVALILLAFETLALVVDLLQKNSDYESNYMFLVRDSGTPFSIVTTMSGGNQVVYTILVMLIYFSYGAIFYGIYYLVKLIAGKKRVSNEQAE